MDRYIALALEIGFFSLNHVRDMPSLLDLALAKNHLFYYHRLFLHRHLFRTERNSNGLAFADLDDLARGLIRLLISGIRTGIAFDDQFLTHDGNGDGLFFGDD